MSLNKTLANQSDEDMFKMLRACQDKETFEPVMNENLPPDLPPVDQRENPNYDLEVKSYLLNETNIWGS